MNRSVIAFVITAIVAAACASSTSPKTCRARTEAAYRECVNPQFMNENEAFQPSTSDESEQCRESYEQSLATCDQPEVTTTSSTTLIPVPR